MNSVETLCDIKENACEYWTENTACRLPYIDNENASN